MPHEARAEADPINTLPNGGYTWGWGPKEKLEGGDRSKTLEEKKRVKRIL